MTIEKFTSHWPSILRTKFGDCNYLRVPNDNGIVSTLLNDRIYFHVIHF